MLFFQEAMFLSGFVAILKVFDLVAKFLFVNKLVLYPVATINFLPWTLCPYDTSAVTLSFDK